MELHFIVPFFHQNCSTTIPPLFYIFLKNVSVWDVISLTFTTLSKSPPSLAYLPWFFFNPINILLCISSSWQSGFLNIHSTYYKEMHANNVVGFNPLKWVNWSSLQQFTEFWRTSYSMNCWLKTDDEDTGWRIFYTRGGQGRTCSGLITYTWIKKCSR